jgi:hypothetical protein
MHHFIDTCDTISSFRDGTTTTTCWYHNRFGANAKKCFQPCTYKSEGKLAQETSAAPHVCTTTAASSSPIEFCPRVSMSSCLRFNDQSPRVKDQSRHEVPAVFYNILIIYIEFSNRSQRPAKLANGCVVDYGRCSQNGWRTSRYTSKHKIVFREHWYACIHTYV